MVTVPSLTLPNLSGAAKPILDPLITGDNGGVRFLFDFGFSFSYPGVGAGSPGNPANGAVVYDIARRANGAWRTTGTAAPTFAGSGVDLSTVDANGEQNTGIAGPASALADIWTAFGGLSQLFLICGYFKLPSSANWNASGSLATFFSAAGAGGYASGPDILNLAMAASTRLSSRRQVAAATHEGEKLITPAAGDFSTVAQIAYWRSATQTVLSMKTAASARQNVTGAQLAANTQDFSALTPLWGCPTPFTSPAAGIFSGFRVYRGWIENLARSARDPITVLDADWARVATRAVFS